MNGERVGTWSILPTGTHEFRYEATWLDYPDVRPISLSLPLIDPGQAHHGISVESFFENLLPDSADIRRRIQRRFAAATGSAFDLLTEIGRDCVGAIQIMPENESPEGIRSIDAETLDEGSIARILRHMVSAPGFGEAGSDDLRISIAGAQEKTALLLQDGTWCRPLKSTPSTHIFKLPLGLIGAMRADMSGSVENEWLCSRIVEALGLPVAHSEIARFEDQRVLVVERFDRKRSIDGTWWMRLPQEDMCQATGRFPSAKYENEGGPGIADVMKILLGSRSALSDRRRFLKAQVLFWIMAAPDGHAKNFSIFIESKGRFVLTPLYDVMSAYPILGHESSMLPPRKLRMAMAVTGKNRHYEWWKIEPRHWVSTASSCGAQADIEDILQELAEALPGALDSVVHALPEGFPSSISDPILEGIQQQTVRLKEGWG